jgi:methylthioribose-1-phosphate isomerase
VKTFEYRDGVLWLLDQTLLPQSETLIECRRHAQVAEAIISLRVRGAPAIGIAAAYGVVLAARSSAGVRNSGNGLTAEVITSIDELGGTRPTAVNLFWALQRMRNVVDTHLRADPATLVVALEEEARRIEAGEVASSRDMASFGSELIPDGAHVLTHCNSGALAAGGYGTALGVIRDAHDRGKRIHVWVDETRPLLQGARLTAWELQQAGVPFTLITDSMAGHFMARRDVDLVMVGADRIAANGDGANKIGTYGLAVLARAHDVPFYFVAPASTVDFSTASGNDIVIEERAPSEVTTIRGLPIAPEGVSVANPAFDVTPAHLVSAIVTDRGVCLAPYVESLRRLAAPGTSEERPADSLGV